MAQLAQAHRPPPALPAGPAAAGPFRTLTFLVLATPLRVPDHLSRTGTRPLTAGGQRWGGEGEERRACEAP